MGDVKNEIEDLKGQALGEHDKETLPRDILVSAYTMESTVEVMPVTEEMVESAKNRARVLDLSTTYVVSNEPDFYFAEYEIHVGDGQATKTVAEQRIDLIINVANWLLGA